jgi:hypothetical protein
MDFSTIGTYTLEGAGTLFLVVLAYKIYKMRTVTESDCCHHAFRAKTVTRGDSDTDLELRAVKQEKDEDGIPVSTI